MILFFFFCILSWSLPRASSTTPLLFPNFLNLVETFPILASLHADVNQANKNGATPMYIAAQKGHSDTVKVLASLHADVNKANKDGMTPLKAATMLKKKDTAAVLRSLGGRM